MIDYLYRFYQIHHGTKLYYVIHVSIIIFYYDIILENFWKNICIAHSPVPTPLTTQVVTVWFPIALDLALLMFVRAVNLS